MGMFAQLLQGQTELKQEIGEVKTDLREVKDRQTIMETEFKETIGGIFDFIESQRNVNQEVVERLERVETKIEVLQLETARIRQVR